MANTLAAFSKKRLALVTLCDKLTLSKKKDVAEMEGGKSFKYQLSDD